MKKFRYGIRTLNRQFKRAQQKNNDDENDDDDDENNDTKLNYSIDFICGKCDNHVCEKNSDTIVVKQFSSDIVLDIDTMNTMVENILQEIDPACTIAEFGIEEI